MAGDIPTTSDPEPTDRARFDGELWSDELFGDVGDLDPLRIVVCDDHLLFRRGVLTAAEEQYDVEVVAEVDAGAEAVAACRELAPDIVLVSLSLDGVDGASLAHAVSRALPTAGIVALTVEDDEPDAIVRVVRSGATGLLDKVDAVEGVVDGVREVGRRRPALSHAVWRSLDRSLADNPVPGVTDAEREELKRLVAAGSHGPGSTRGLNRLRNLLARLRVHPPPEIVAAAIHHGLLPHNS